ncbi:13105_t:CDS:2, partial [Ambispora leptoticha]
IPPYEFKHDGKHVHEAKKIHECDGTCPSDLGKHVIEENKKQNFHYCDVKCPNCAYYCTLPYDHGREHNSEHGHRLNVGDRGDFVLCHKLCENIGRHRHIDYCKDPAVCRSLVDGRKEGILDHIK